MYSSARAYRLVALLLQATVALTIIATRAQGQVVDIRPCQNYQSAKDFDRDYVAKLVTEDQGYSLLLTSQQPGTSSCERLTLRLNGTFIFFYSDSEGVSRNHSGRFAVKDASFTQPGHIDLDLPPGVFGAALFNNLRLFVIVADEDYFVATSCQAIGLISVERVHVFVATSKLNATTATSLNTSLVEMKVPHTNRLREVSQNCSTAVRVAAGTNGSSFSQLFGSRAPLTQFISRLSNPNQWLLPQLLGGRHADNGIVLPSFDGRHFTNGVVLPPLQGRHASRSIALPSLDGRHASSGSVFSSDAHQWALSTAPQPLTYNARGSYMEQPLTYNARGSYMEQPLTYNARGSYMEQPQSYSLTTSDYSGPDLYGYNFVSSLPNYGLTLLNYFPSEPKYLSPVVNYHPLLFNIPASPVNQPPLATSYPSSAFHY